MNDPLRRCPRCRLEVCEHDERLIANALARVGTGIMNLDISVAYRWMSSLRRHCRTAFIELKPPMYGGDLPLGQRIGLLDITGKLTTESGYEFEQRSFVVERVGSRFRLSTFYRRGSLTDIPRLWTVLEDGHPEECATVISDWLRTGHIVYTIS